MSDDDIEINVKGLDQLMKAISAKAPPTIRIGILEGAGGRANESGGSSGPTNAQIGAWHEFGTSTLPVRSFLRLPLTTQLQRYLARNGAFSPEALARVMREGSLMPYAQKIAATAETVVADAFATGGFGTWPPSDMRHKKVHMTLIETQQLRNSISSEVKE